MSWKKIILYFVGFVYLVLTIVFWFGLAYCLNRLPEDPVLTDLHYTVFGIGFTALPAILLAGGSVGFYCDLTKELFKLKSEEKTGH